MNKKRRLTDRYNNMWEYSYKVEYNLDQAAFDRFFTELAKQQQSAKTREVIDNEMISMDLLETVVEDSNNAEAISLLNGIGIKCK